MQTNTSEVTTRSTHSREKRRRWHRLDPRVRTRIERSLVSPGMSVVAWLLERAVVGTSRVEPSE